TRGRAGSARSPGTTAVTGQFAAPTRGIVAPAAAAGGMEPRSGGGTTQRRWAWVVARTPEGCAGSSSFGRRSNPCDPITRTGIRWVGLRLVERAGPGAGARDARPGRLVDRHSGRFRCPGSVEI